MTPGVTRFLPNPGRAAAGGPIRENIFTHYFVGGNAMLPGLLGSPEHDKLAQERLKSAAKRSSGLAVWTRMGISIMML